MSNISNISTNDIENQINAYCLRNKIYDILDIEKNHPYYLYNKLSYEIDNPFTLECPVKIDKSIYGKGMFAIRDIKKGSVCCIYPAHGVSYPSITRAISDTPKDSFCTNIVIKEQAHYYEDIFKNTDYTFTGENGIKIYGCPLVNNHNWLCGHLCNDMAFKKENLPRDKTSHSEIARFVLSYMLNNKNNNTYVKFLEVHSISFLIFIANRDISKGEEISENYEENYWLSRNNIRNEKGSIYTKEELLNILMLYLINKPVSQRRYYFNLIKKLSC